MGAHTNDATSQKTISEVRGEKLFFLDVIVTSMYKQVPMTIPKKRRSNYGETKLGYVGWKKL